MIEIGKVTFNRKAKWGGLKRSRGWIAEDFIFEVENENKKNKRKKDNPLRD
jgi:hypothetical protein